ncbi:hypothetical protein [Falsiroseomonas sp. E2-1-a4]|uniref:hypothetical protein n=1 Tax=Falsiroseomonas sp. E2-1-a4 TaxID=3239299 RepID=UPI003F39F3C3
MGGEAVASIGEVIGSVVKLKHRRITAEVFQRIHEQTQGSKRMALVHDAELLSVMLSKLLLRLVKRARPDATEAQAKLVSGRLEALQRAIAESSETRVPPPPIPADWLNAMQSWIEGHAWSFKDQGRGEISFNIHVYPSLLAFYEFAFGRPASASPGPTHRFLRACVAEVRSVLTDQGYTAKRWTLAGDDAVEKQITSRWKAPYQERARREVQKLFVSVRADYRIQVG